MTFATFLDAWISYFGGAAVLIAVASFISAYNQYLSRKYLQEIRDTLQQKR